jgi:hypothetical protein
MHRRTSPLTVLARISPPASPLTFPLYFARFVFIQSKTTKERLKASPF